MANEKTMYWLTLGLFALTFGHAAINHGLSNRVEAIAVRISDRLATHADLALDRSYSKVGQSQAKLACAQSQLASLQASMALRQADFAQLQTARAQFVVLQKAQRVAISCPRIRINAALKGIRIPAPTPVNIEGSL